MRKAKLVGASGLLAGAVTSPPLVGLAALAAFERRSILSSSSGR